MSTDLSSAPVWSEYTCPRCGVWVGYNASHSCYAQPWPPSPARDTSAWVNPYEGVLQRIAGALERIAEALESAERTKGESCS